jgi:hypothetical protein
VPTDPQQPQAERTVPEMPSFASLRDPRRRSPIDLLVPPVAEEEAVIEPVVVPDVPAAAPRPAARPAPRPAEYADLLPAALRLARWTVACLRRLLG